MKFFIVTSAQTLDLLYTYNLTFKEALRLPFKPNILISFIEFYNSKKTFRYIEMLKQQTNIFLVDSGAFSFMNNPHLSKKISLDTYVEKYAQFLRDYEIPYFFEMDVDSVTGYQKVIEYRNFIERVTHKQSIPVWHKNRGLDEYKRMIERYRVVALGGIVIKEIKLPQENGLLNSLTLMAHEKNVWVHGLGIGVRALRNKYFFDSTDACYEFAFRKFRAYWYYDANKKVITKRYRGLRIMDKDKAYMLELENVGKVAKQLMKLDKNPQLTELRRL